MQPGTVVWARARNNDFASPWWPARVAEPQEAHYGRDLPLGAHRYTAVVFFGDDGEDGLVFVPCVPVFS